MSSLLTIILKANGKKHWKKVAQQVQQNNSLEEFMNYFLNGENDKIIQRSSGVFMALVDEDKNLFYPYQQELIEKLKNPNIHPAQQRNIFRLFQTAYIQDEIEGELLNESLKVLENPSLAVSIRVFAMSVAFRIGLKFPEVLPELKSLIVLNLDMNPSSGLKNRSEKILSQIEKLIP